VRADLHRVREERAKKEKDTMILKRGGYIARCAVGVSTKNVWVGGVEWVSAPIFISHP
jgi:hypothetical protein